MPRSLAPDSVEAEDHIIAAPQELSIGDMLQIFLQSRRTILASVLGLLILAGIYLAWAPRKYTATATIEINKDNTMSLGLDDLSGIGSKLGTGTDLLTDLSTHQADLENETTALDTIKRMNLLTTEPYAVAAGKSPELDAERGRPMDQAPFTREHALTVFLRRLKVQVVKNTRLISVSYTDTDPARAAAVANTVVEVYLSNHTEARYAASLKTSNWLTAQLAELKDKVAESERKVSDFQQKAGLVGVYISATEKPSSNGAGLPQVNSVEDERLIALNNELTQAEVQRIAREALFRFAQTGDPNVVAGLTNSGLLDKGALGAGMGSAISALQALRQQQTALKLQYTAAAGKYGQRNPELLDLKNQLTVLDDQIRSELERIQEQTKGDYEVAVLAEKSIRDQVDRQEKAVGRLDQSVAGLLVLEQESSSNRLLYQDMYTRLEEANLTAGLGAGVITISDPARSPARPSSPKVAQVIAVALAAGLLLGALAAIALDQLRNILYTVDDFGRLLPFALLGVVPDFNSSANRRGYGAPGASKGKGEGQDPKGDLGRIPWLHVNPTSPVSEAFRQIRTSVLMSKSARPPRTMLLTSAISSDGKTVTSFNLAVAFAYQGARVLLVDADMRRPSIHLLANISSEVGLSSVLTGLSSATDAIQAHAEVPRLSIMPAGPIPPMPAELLGSARFNDLLKELEGSFDYVLLDTPPLLLVTDPLLLASKVEGVILVTRPGRDTRHAIKSVTTLLRRPQVHVLGYVINGISMHSTYYRYDYTEREA